MKSKLFLFVMLAMFIGASSAQAATILSFQSSPESWVGQGQSWTVTPDDGYLFLTWPEYYNNYDYMRLTVATLNSSYGPDFDPYSGEEYHYWELWLSAPFLQPLEVGFYDNADKIPGENINQPRLNFFGDHRGNNTLSGFFEVLEIAFDSSGSLARFAVDFTQYDEKNPENWITGQFRYNSDIPISSVPVPAGIWLLGSGCAVLIGLRKKRQRPV